MLIYLFKNNEVFSFQINPLLLLKPFQSVIIIKQKVQSNFSTVTSYL